MREEVTVAQSGVEAVDDLRGLFLALHRHHRSIVDLPLVDDDAAWRARRATYLAWFAEQRALLFVASAGGAHVGYALVVWHDGSDDTFPLAPRSAEVYTLSVAEEARGLGVGGRLLDAVDRALAAAGDPPLAGDGRKHRRTALLRPAGPPAGRADAVPLRRRPGRARESGESRALSAEPRPPDRRSSRKVACGREGASTLLAGG